MSAPSQLRKTTNYADIVRSFPSSNIPEQPPPPHGEGGNTDVPGNSSLPTPIPQFQSTSAGVGSENIASASSPPPKSANAPIHHSNPANPAILSITENEEPSQQNPKNPEPDHNLISDVSLSCLLGKPFGDPIPSSVVIAKLRREWSVLKGEVSFVEMGNGWVMFKFSNHEDKTFVWEHRPWADHNLHLLVDRLKASTINSPRTTPAPHKEAESSGRWIKVVPKRKGRTSTATKKAKVQDPGFKTPQTEANKLTQQEKLTNPVTSQLNVSTSDINKDNLHPSGPQKSQPYVSTTSNLEPLLANETIEEADPEYVEALQTLQSTIPPPAFPPIINEYGSNIGHMSPSSSDTALAHELSEVDKLFLDALGHGKEITISSESSKRRRTEDEEDSASSKQKKK
ncbi:hypothetical protein BVRB_6g155560 [Beta vulgaris subsp. vulgaris]|uniref:DUF4283 domain-containing protein n=1 Tax=Beta vulgaris subsp. vulgaris TaxID=3555 RepID=A0A0J8BBR0_BETVV|nr:hypothetical protein BVRB_6g155560 [Beta vulgaris subsp. vulgaris]